ncbi:putative quinol monooxygenase [Mycobacterium sp.]|uniref:putative quinol monooxygenase n=1 Tax=Mycobacterium sp. TaxID=1785 RepID=UPI0031E1E58C
MANPDSGTVIIATVTATPQNRDDLLRALQELLPAARAESGVCTFLLHENRSQPGQFTLYEHFRDQTAIDTHFSSPHFSRISNALAQYASGPPILTYHQPLQCTEMPGAPDECA